ncbi:MAG: hypothetical protein GY787_32480 [Alteromonadales bacterium]|nr:hypothetical protein [Alteromonadales bacterium]
MSAEQVRSDTLTLLLCNQVNKFLDDKSRSIKISKCCKIVRDRTKDDVLYKACRSIINANSKGLYAKVIEAMNKTEENYYREYKNAIST